MKRHISSLALSLLAACAFADVAPRKYYDEIARRMTGMLPRYHVLKTRMNDGLSVQAWTNLVTFYDFDHSVFLRSDLDALGSRMKTLDDELKKGDVSFGFTVFNLYLRRLGERMAFATNYVATADFDFGVEEAYRIRRKDAPWPADAAEAEEHWRKRLKNELLAQVVAGELDAAKTTNRFDFAAAVEAGRTNLVKRYRQYAQLMVEPDEEQVLQHYRSSVARAYDPHSDYMSPASKEDFDIDMNLTLCGVGAVLQLDEGALKIVEVMPGGPMDRDGRVKEGDKIVGVKQQDGEMEDITWRPMRKSIRKIRGPKGTKVTLEIVPRGDASGASRKTVELVRDEIKLEDQAATGRVERVTLDGATRNLGYVYLPSFYGTMDKRPGDLGYRSCANDVAKYLADFNSQGVEGLVLDFRGNGGGSLREAVMLSALFVHSGPVVQVRDLGTTHSLSIPYGNPVAFKRPMVVLTDRASASASEIVAAHLHDTGRAIVLGDGRTHGKGTVQSVMGMGPESFGSMKITTARFYRVNGESTQIEGMPADFRLPSLLDALDIGEDKLPNALPFSRILPADYARCWNLNKYVPELKRLAEARLEKDERYQKHLENVRGMKEISEREVVSLERETRKAQMAADRELRELDDDDDEDGDSDGEEKPAKRRRRNERAKDDVVLDSAFDVLYDLIRLNGGAELPRPRTNGGWFNSIIGGGY